MGTDDKKPISVMIVDDEQELVDFLAKRLRIRGYAVDTAQSGDAALERLDGMSGEGVAEGVTEEVAPEAQEPTCVLVVDDEQELLLYLSKRLRKRGFLVDTAEDGEAALARLDGSPDQDAEAEKRAAVDVVVLDVKMVGMTGLETLKTIKAEHPLVEVIMLTGHASVQGALDALKTGALDYLTKPCDINVLVEKVGVAKSRRDVRKDKEAAKP